MWRKSCWCVLAVFLSAISVNLVLAVSINEVMPHSNNSLGDEWIEIYNNENLEINLTNWKIGDISSNDTINLTISAGGFAIITNDNINCTSFSVSNKSCFELATIGSGLNDDDEKIYLYDNSSNII